MPRRHAPCRHRAIRLKRCNQSARQSTSRPPLPSRALSPSRRIDPTFGSRSAPAEFLCAKRQAFLRWRTRTAAQAFVDLRLVAQTQLDWIHIELDRQLIHRGSARTVPAPRPARASTWASRIALGQPRGDAQIRHAVHVRRRLAAILLVIVEDRCGIDVIMLQRDELAVAARRRGGCAARCRPMADSRGTSSAGSARA